MARTFLSRRSRLFRLPNALVIMMLVFFALPFGLRGARDSLDRMENKITDWLPSKFPETKRLAWFQQHFVGEQFVLITWDGCTKDSDSYQLFVKRLRSEVIDEDPFDTELEKIKDVTPTIVALDKDVDGQVSKEEAAGTPLASKFDLRDGNEDGFIDRTDLLNYKERLRARELGDRLGLHLAGDFRQNWGNQGERWLQDRRGHWYYITPDGTLYKWEGRPNVVSGIKTFTKRNIFGKRDVSGERIAQFTDKGRVPRAWNSFWDDPGLLTARYFNSVRTGPDVVEELTAKGGPLRPRANISEAEKVRRARNLATSRLTGSLFAPAVPDDFDWSADAFHQLLPKDKQDELPSDWRERFTAFVKKTADRRFKGDISQIAEQTRQTQSDLWDQLFGTLDLEPPDRQTCIMVTLSESGKRDLKNVLGRGLLGDPPGKIIHLAEMAGIEPPPEPPISPFKKEPEATGPVIRMGGPPVDNVAIDEEGQITLVRLVGFSCIVGVGLSLLCFRSIKVTNMLFFVGGVSAIASLAIVWYVGGTVDAILMSMPSLVYVLGLSGAVHIVNYYRDAVEEEGVEGAPERAVRHGWWPCTLAAFTTSLGLFSLCRSNIIPISKFGFYSALGVMATLVILFAYLPSSLQLTPPKFKKRDRRTNAREGIITRIWTAIGNFVIKRHGIVTGVCTVVLIVVGFGLTKVETSVELLELFDGNAKVIRDYKWLEANFGKLVPMEVVINVPQEFQAEVKPKGESNSDKPDSLARSLSLLDRMELTALVQASVERELGEQRRGVVGRGMSAATFAPSIPSPTYRYRHTINRKLLQEKGRLPVDYVTTDPGSSNELWRISLRLGAFNDTDFGVFVNDLRQVVNPILAAYKFRGDVLSHLEGVRGSTNPKGSKVLVIGASPFVASKSDEEMIDQNAIFARTLHRIMLVRGFGSSAKSQTPLLWHDPKTKPLADFDKHLASADCVVITGDPNASGLDAIRSKAKHVVIATDFDLPEVAPENDPENALASNNINVTYTGVVPIVFKAQRQLLKSLMDSIGWAFVMIAVVMMLLLRYARSSLLGVVNVGGGLTSMIPNVFPVVVIFGAMGHLGFKVDIGSMMTASVAMGVAVDDTIHFLTWFRSSLEQGHDRHTAIKTAYRRVSAAMTQTTLIGGFGLSVFAFSTFTPTQRFGVLMLTLLAAALVGDLILLPAILAGPLGKLFEPRKIKRREETPAEEAPLDEPVDDEPTDTAQADGEEDEVADEQPPPKAKPGIPGPHASRRDAGVTRRTDPGHNQ